MLHKIVLRKSPHIKTNQHIFPKTDFTKIDFSLKQVMKTKKYLFAGVGYIKYAISTVAYNLIN